MPESPTGFIPEELIHQSKKAEVIEWLRKVPLESKRKRDYLLGWAITVGVKLNRADYAKVTPTGIDREG
jgi:hypothetical protein